MKKLMLLWWRTYKWFTLWWWKYLFTDNYGIRNIICRVNGHRHVSWYTTHAVEPDMHCENCGEDLG